MKIKDITAHIMWSKRTNLFIVKVTTDEGLYGYGEAGLISRERGLEGAVAHFREFLIGKDPMLIGALWQEMYRGQYFEGGRILTGAISAIDIALHDIVGKKLGVPVYQLLGGAHRSHIPCFATIQGPLGPETLEGTKRLVKEGWQAIRFVPLRPDPGDDGLLFEPTESSALTAEWLIKIREEVGRGPVLGIDYHHRLSVAEAASFCQMLPPGTLDFLEEPIRGENPEAYAALRRMTQIPFAIGEEFSSKWAFVPFIERGLTDFARLDVCNVGGFTEAVKVAGWCEAHYIDIMPHNPLGPVATAAAAHLAAAVPNFAWLEVQPDCNFNVELFPNQLELEGTHLPLPTAPGLGVEVNEQKAGGPFRFYEHPHWHRRDGSYTNW